MKRQILIGLVALYLATSPILSAEQPTYKPGVVFVRFANVGMQPPSTATKNSILNSVLQSSGTPVKQEYAMVSGLTKVAIPAGMSVENAVASLKQSSSVLYAEPVYRYQLFAVPNDTRFGELWGMRNIGQTSGTPGADIDATSAWDISTGSSGIIVAVTDTGVDYNHPDLSANIWVNPGEIPNNGIDDEGNGYIDDVHGYDSGDFDGDPMDDALDGGHGTHVAGTIGAVGNNNRGVTGVCWNVKIMAVKIADSNGILYGVIDGIDYAVRNGAKVINASWGGAPYSQALYDSILAARNAGVIFVASAGNDSSNNDSAPRYPTGYNLANIISVMATSNADSMSYYSNYGLTSVDIGAPGGEQSFENDPRGILSTWPGNQYRSIQGTSMASPHVAGACALLLSIKPTMTYAEVKQLLMSTVDPVLPGLCVSGGRMNLAAAAQEAATDSTPPSVTGWDIEPNATGFHTVTMQAKAASDLSGVEYYFECVNDVTINSGWVSDTLYSFSTLSPSTTYGFRFKARDKSAQQNEADWSNTVYTTTSQDGIDNLPPVPNPARWAIKPKIQRLSPLAVRMKAFGVDESGVQYQFKYWDNNEPNVYWYSGPWQDSDTWTYTTGKADHSYSFQCWVKDKSTSAEPNRTAFSTPPVSVSIRSGPTIISVPAQYERIQDAIDASSDGDIVEISPWPMAPYTYRGDGNRNITFRGRKITVRSIDPENPAIVAATVIDCEGTSDPLNPRRAFVFESGEDSNSILAGLTIRNGYVKGYYGLPGSPGTDANPDGSIGGSGGPAQGGAILCDLASSPTIRGCIIENCVAEGGDGGRGGDGADGTDFTEGTPADSNTGDPGTPGTLPKPGGDGGRGGNSGYAYGGAIYCYDNSSIIQNCVIRNCQVLAGNAGNGGDGGDGGQTQGDSQLPGGNGGNGGNVRNVKGGGIYAFCESGYSVQIIGCTVTECGATNNGAWGQFGIGGEGNPPGLNGFDGVWDLSAYGGGIYYITSGAANISSTTISQNYTGHINGINAPAGGIGIESYLTSTITMSDCVITANDPNGDGGGILFWNDGGHLILRNCDLTNNDGAMRGGGLAVWSTRSSVIDIYDSNVAGNSANYGGGLLLDQVALTIHNSSLQDNVASEGGAITAFDGSVNISNSQITGNSANIQIGLGGGLALWNITGDIIDSNISNNTTSGFGGAAFIAGWTDSPVNFKNCLISDNIAVIEGGGLACNVAGWARLDNCSVANNTVTDPGLGSGGGVISTEMYAWVEIYNSIFWGNSAANGPQIAIGAPLGPYCDGTERAKADVDVSYSDIEGGESNVYLMDPTYECTALWWLTGNIDTDPRFAFNYYLSWIEAGQDIDSPCVNAGSADVNNIDIGLAAYTTRTDGIADAGIVDMGYHHLAGIPTQFAMTLEVFDAGYGGYGRLNAKPQPQTIVQFDVNDPNTILVNQGTIVNLTAIPEPNFRVQSWSGTDNDNSTASTNKVTMDSDKTIVVTFEPNDAYFLTVSVAGGAGTVDPNGRSLRAAGEVVQLTADPCNQSDVITWSGTDDDYSHLPTNKVTMNGHKDVTVKFYSPKILYVGADGDFLTIQQGINEAGDGDIVMVLPGTYDIYESSEDDTQLSIINKAITLTSVDPTHPEDTVILGGFIILNVGRDTVIDGFTIQGNYGWLPSCDGENTNCGNPLPDGMNGYPIAGGGMKLHLITDWVNGGPMEGTEPFSASPTVRNCVFQNCSILGGGGGDGSTGNGGWAGWAHGGAVSVGPDSNPIFENCVFTGNRAYGGDGGNGGDVGHGGNWGNTGIFWQWEPPTGYLDYWRYSGYGGAVYCDFNSVPEFNNCTFTNNIAYGGSSGISANVAGWPHSHYQIDRYGGAIYAATTSRPNFTNCIFTGNEADLAGLRWHWAYTDADDSAIEYENLSYGGAIAFEDSAAPEFNNCTIAANIAHIGGGAWSDDAYPFFVDSRFISNVANDGAGMLIVDGQARILKTDFITNAANIAGSEGGALGLYGTNADIIDSNITGNTSLGYGGGIYISSKYIDGETLDGNSSVFVKNCLITNNRATQGGAGISAAWHSDPNIVNCTITGNVSSAGPGGGLYASYSNFTTIVNSIIWGNLALTGNEIAVGVPVSPSRVDVSYSDIKQTVGSTNVQAGSALNLNAGVISSNPLFAGGLGNYYLSQGAAGQSTTSPCVDAGIGDVNDLRIELGGYTTRTDSAPDENTVDMGYHYQPVVYSEELFHLTISIIGPGSVSVQPVSDGNYPGNTIVTITATPDSGFRVRKWTNTDNDDSASLINTVTILGNTNVSIEFGVPAMLTVPGDYTTIQGAVTSAKAGDIISIASGVYDTPNLVIDKDITLTSSNPDDPCVVAATVIDGADQACYGVIFTSNTSEQTVLNGITIANCGYGHPDADDGEDPGDAGGNGTNSDGAGIVIRSGARPTIKNCVVRNCAISGGNAGDGSNADDITDAGRGGWGGWAHGAGIYVASFANPTIINTKITDNIVIGGNGGNGGDFAEDGGFASFGGNWSDGAAWEIWGYVGDYRFYSGYGAGVYCDRDSSATFIACSIANNTAQGGVSGIGGSMGEGIQIPPPDASYEIPAYGGGVYCAANSRVTFTDCNITGNTAVKPDVTYHVDPYLGHGGGIAFEDTALIRLANCTISDNNSAVGGGIYWSGGTPEVIDCNIINNSAYIGGGIYGTHSVGLIQNCAIRTNFAGVLPTDVDVVIGQGGGVYASSMGALIEDCLITENTTDASGGGIYIYGVSDAATTIKNCLMLDNEAGRDGGAVSANWEAVVDVINCTIYSNRATGAFGLPGTNGFGGGLYCSYGADTDIKNCIFWDNNSPYGWDGLKQYGTQIAVESGSEFVQLCGTVSVSYSDINGGVASGVWTGNCESSLIWGPGNIDANALFIDTSEYNFRLSQQEANQSSTSPCVDAGSDYSSKFGLHRYTTRTDRAPDILTVDMGYHYYRPGEYCFNVYHSSDGIVNFDDLSYIALSWLSKDCTEFDGWCQGRDITYDGAVDNYDLMDFSMCWLHGFGSTCDNDVTPPTPNPMRWETPPEPTSGSSVRMVAREADAGDGELVQYQIEKTVNGNFAGLSGLQTIPTFVETGLLPATQYCYRVRAVDLCGNVTDWSESACVENLGDTNAPEPPPTIVFNVAVHTVLYDVCDLSGQFQFPYEFPDFDQTYWHKVVVNVAGIEDDSGGPVSIRFNCTSKPAYNSENIIPLAYRPILVGTEAQDTLGSKALGWRLTYNGDTIIYDVKTTKVGGTGVSETWEVCALDESLNPACSLPHTIGP